MAPSTNSRQLTPTRSVPIITQAALAENQGRRNAGDTITPPPEAVVLGRSTSVLATHSRRIGT